MRISLRSCLLLSAAACFLSSPCFAAKQWAGARIKNTTGQTVNDLHVIFSAKVNDAVAKNKFNTATPVGGAPSNTWDFSGGSVTNNSKEVVRWESGAITNEEIDEAQWTIDGVKQGVIDDADITPLRTVEVSYSVSPAGLGQVTHRLLISNGSPDVGLRIEGFEAYTNNSTVGVTADNYEFPTGPPVGGWPAVINIPPGTFFDTGPLPAMDEESYALFTGLLIETTGSQEDSLDWAYGRQQDMQAVPAMSTQGLVISAVLIALAGLAVLLWRSGPALRKS